MLKLYEDIDISLIPSGIYCHDLVNPKTLLRTNVCPYWQKTYEGAYCELLHQHSETGDPNNLIWDMVKECGVKEERNNQEKENPYVVSSY